MQRRPDSSVSPGLQKYNLLNALLRPISVILLDFLLPISSKGGAGAYGGRSTANRLVVEASALAVTMVVHGSFRNNSQTASCLHRVDISTQEEELPPIFLLMMTDHLPDMMGGIAETGILHAVSGDDEQCVFRYVLAPGVFVDIPDVLDGSADSVQQSSAAPTQ